MPGRLRRWWSGRQGRCCQRHPGKQGWLRRWCSARPGRWCRSPAGSMMAGLGIMHAGLVIREPAPHTAGCSHLHAPKQQQRPPTAHRQASGANRQGVEGEVGGYSHTGGAASCHSNSDRAAAAVIGHLQGGIACRQAGQQVASSVLLTATRSARRHLAYHNPGPTTIKPSHNRTSRPPTHQHRPCHCPSRSALGRRWCAQWTRRRSH